MAMNMHEYQRTQTLAELAAARGWKFDRIVEIIAAPTSAADRLAAIERLLTEQQ